MNYAKNVFYYTLSFVVIAIFSLGCLYCNEKRIKDLEAQNYYFQRFEGLHYVMYLETLSCKFQINYEESENYKNAIEALKIKAFEDGFKHAEVDLLSVKALKSGTDKASEKHLANQRAKNN